jgi:hypothetical protein
MRARDWLRVLALAIVCAHGAGCVANSPATPPAPPSAEDDELAVWQAALAHLRSGGSARTLIVVDSAVTTEWQDEEQLSLASILGALPVPRSAVEDLYRVSRTRSHPRSRAGDLDGVTWITRAEFSEYEAASLEGRRLLAARYPDAQRRVIAISRVGFDPRREDASLFTLYWCGPLCASLNLVVLHRSAEGAWEVMRDTPLVVS